MDCNEVMKHLPDLLYDELDPQQKKAVEQHNQVCSCCRMELETLRQTVGTLNQWHPIEAPCNAGQIAAQAEARVGGERSPATQSLLIRWRPTLTGFAAGIVIFLGLLWLNAEITYNAGRLTIALGRPATVVIEPLRTVAPDSIPENLHPFLQKAIRQEFNSNTDLTLTALEERLHDWQIAQDRRYSVLIDGIVEMYAHDQERLKENMATLAFLQEQNSIQTHQALDEVVELVSNTKPLNSIRKFQQ